LEPTLSPTTVVRVIVPDEPPTIISPSDKQERKEVITRAIRFQCPHCKKSYGNRHRLERHLNRDHKPVQCNVCKVYFKAARELNRHKICVHERRVSYFSKCGNMDSFRRDNIYRHERGCPLCIVYNQLESAQSE